MSEAEKRHAQLGMNFSTAQHRLRKDIMFHLLSRLGENVCYQCGASIDNVSELSIEHKVPWLHAENPAEVFFDLSNIAFSHLSCNARKGRKHTTSPEHKKVLKKAKNARYYTPERRREYYLRTGK